MQNTIRTHFRTHVAAAALLLVPAGAALLATGPAAAQHQQRARPAITSLSVDADHGLAPGSTLRLQALATPGARWATVSLGEGAPRVSLREQDRGRYVGSYIVRRGDRIDPSVFMTARFDHGGLVTSRNFSFPPDFLAAAPTIERFAVRHAGRLEPGRELRFRVVGSADGRAWVDIPGVERGIQLREERPGVYEGSYTVRRRDDRDAFARAVATLQAGQQRVTARAEFRDRDARDDRYGFDDPRLPLDVTSHADNGLTDARGQVYLQGRTAPHATVRIQMNTVAELAGVVGVTQPVADVTVRADGRGEFGVRVQPSVVAIPGSRYEVHLTATSGRDVAEERLVLRSRG